jgi:hypothetical protein
MGNARMRTSKRMKAYIWCTKAVVVMGTAAAAAMLPSLLPLLLLLLALKARKDAVEVHPRE